MIRFFPREFTVEPGKRQAIRIMARIPPETPDGQYHAHIHFFEDDKKQEENRANAQGQGKATMRVNLAYSALMPVTIGKGVQESTINWINPKIARSAKPGVKPGTYNITMQLTRSGNSQGVAYLDAIYVPPGGESVQLGKRRTAYIYREIDKRNYNFDVTLPEGMSGGNLKLRLLSGDKTKPTLINEATLSIP